MPLRSARNALGVGSERLRQVEEAAAHRSIVDLVVGGHEFVRLTLVQRVGVESLLGRFRKAGDRRSADRIGGVKEKLHRNVEDPAQIVQPAGADPIGAPLIFLYLLEGQAERLT